MIRSILRARLAFQYVNDFHENVLGFCNTIYNSEGGSHLTGFKTALTTVLNQYARMIGVLKEKDENFSGPDVRTGLTAVLSIKHPDPRFEGQTKTKLDNQDASKAVAKVTQEQLVLFFDRNTPSRATASFPTANRATRRNVRSLLSREIRPEAALRWPATANIRRSCRSRARS